MSQLNDIHADIGALQAQMEHVAGSLEKIATIVTTIALHDERIINIKKDVADHSDYIDGSKKRQWTFGGIVIAGSAFATGLLNHIFKIIP